MSQPNPQHIIVVGAGAAGLMAARELATAGRRVTLLESRNRCGGRIYPLPTGEFGYAAEGGAEFVHGEAPVTHGLLREAGLEVSPIQGTPRTMDGGQFVRRDNQSAHQAELQKALQDLTDDLTVAEFLRRHFAGPEFTALRRTIERMTEGYDAADPERASTLVLRDEWMVGGHHTQGRIIGGYGALVAFLAAECLDRAVEIHLGAAVSTIEEINGSALVRCENGDAHSADAVILTVPLPILDRIGLPAAERERAAAAAQIGFGNVIKLLLRFETAWWYDDRSDLMDLTFLSSDGQIPVWWTQHPADLPVLTGWFAGPRTEAMAHFGEDKLLEVGLESLAETFGRDRTLLQAKLVTARAINWSRDPYAGGAYSYATPATRRAQAVLSRFRGGRILFSGEALYGGRDMGTVEAALASGLDTARILLGKKVVAEHSPANPPVPDLTLRGRHSGHKGTS
jgi:monoamine oxidase